MTKNYKITLEPLDWFFFGGEITYGGSDLANYYAESRMFPQESSLLGMLRYELLKAKGLLYADESSKKLVVEEIGELGFDEKAKNAPIGKIIRISPVMLQYRDVVYYHAPFDDGVRLNFISEKEEDVKVYINGTKNVLPTVDKNNLELLYQSKDKWLPLIRSNNVPIYAKTAFIEKMKIGITKRNVDRDDENKDGLFKGKLYKLQKGYKFAFYVQLDAELPETSLVNLGAERSIFRLEAQQITNDDFWDHLWNDVSIKENQILLLSEAFVPEDIKNYCNFIWSDTISFRCIKRKWKSSCNYASLDKVEERTSRYNLLRRGSVIYYNKENEFEIKKRLDNLYLQRFGYNVYK